MCSSHICLTGTPVLRTVSHSASASGPSASGSLFRNSGSSRTGQRIESATTSTIAPAQAGSGHSPATAAEAEQAQRDRDSQRQPDRARLALVRPATRPASGARAVAARQRVAGVAERQRHRGQDDRPAQARSPSGRAGRPSATTATSATRPAAVSAQPRRRLARLYTAAWRCLSGSSSHRQLMATRSRLERKLAGPEPGLVVEQPGLAGKSAAVAGELAVAADDAVARDDDRDRVPAVGVADSARRPGSIDPAGQLAVADRLAEGDAAQLRPHATLELRARGCERQVEVGQVPGEVAVELPLRLGQHGGVAGVLGSERVIGEVRGVEQRQRAAPSAQQQLSDRRRSDGVRVGHVSTVALAGTRTRAILRPQ